MKVKGVAIIADYTGLVFKVEVETKKGTTFHYLPVTAGEIEDQLAKALTVGGFVTAAKGG